MVFLGFVCAFVASAFLLGSQVLLRGGGWLLIFRLLASFVIVFPGAGEAMELELPGQASMVAGDERDGATVRLPVSPWSGDTTEFIEENGLSLRRVWQVRATNATTLQLSDSIASQMEAAGFEPVFQCHDVTCGGFDFRFLLDLIGEPEMHVDLRDYRYLVATSETGALSALVSRNGPDAFLHLTEVTEDKTAAPLQVRAIASASAPSTTLENADEGEISATLRAQGHALLPDLEFATGSSALGASAFPSLAELGAFLNANPDARIVLVGHTDADGGLAPNIALSERRAAAVRTRLIEAHGADGSRIAADGVGFLAPVATNETAAGREANRRVEVILDR